MNTYKIEHGIKITGQQRRKGKLTRTFLSMRSGDSFLYKGNRSNAWVQASNIGVKIITRAEGKGWRIWKK